MLPSVGAGKLVARERQRERAIGAVLAGRGAAIIGSCGVGKTALIAALARQLDPSRFDVEWVVATEAGASVPFGAFARLLDYVAKPITSRRLVAELVTRAAGRIPVLVIDDAHQLDGWSADFALGLAGAQDVRLLVTACTPAPEPVVALWKDGYLTRVDLGSFELGDTAELLRVLLDGAVAEPTTRLLQQWTGGNLSSLTELTRHGRTDGSLIQVDGLWWWRGGLTVSARLSEYVAQSLDTLGTDAQDALIAVAIGEPVPLANLEMVASDHVEILEEKGFVRVTEVHGHIEVTMRQPVVGEVLRHRLKRLRRRRIASGLLDSGEPADVVTRARWYLEADRQPDVRLLVEAADATCRYDPDFAYRVAVRALDHSDVATVPLANALVELGESAKARQVLERGYASSARLRSGIALAAHRCWVDRDPVGAHEDLLRLSESAVSPTGWAVAAGVDALVLLFHGRTGDALMQAERAIGRSRRGTAVARLVRATCFALSGRTADGEEEAAALALARDPVGPAYLAGAAKAVRSLAQLWRTVGAAIPDTDLALGRWPGSDGALGATWPLLHGYQLWLDGRCDRAIDRLREAVFQQSGGHRLFRTEAVSWLAICLAEQGHPHDATHLLATHRPDDVGVLPGQAALADAAVATARGDPAAAGAAMARARAAARAAGAWSVELGYLTYAHWHTPSSTSDELYDRIRFVRGRVDAQRLVIEADAVVAVRRGDGAEILDYAVRHDAMGLTWTAWRLAESASRLLAERSGPRRPEAMLLAGRLRARLGVAKPALVRSAPAVPLTRREAEVAALAGVGLPDREIARRLSLSTRTVHSHLSRVYQKLGVHSRRELPAGLGDS